MSRDFRHLDDLHDFVADLVIDVSLRLDEPGIGAAIVNLIDRTDERTLLHYGLDRFGAYDDDSVQSLPADTMRRVVLSDCVEAARRQRRTRAIGYPRNLLLRMLTSRVRDPLWSCHADLLVVSGFLAKGYDRSQIGLLGPGSATPAPGERNAYPGTIVDPCLPIGQSPFQQHYVRDGLVHAHISLDVRTDAAGHRDYGQVEILSDHRSAVSIHGHDLPDTALTGLAGQPLHALLAHPVTDRVPGLPILEARRSEGNVTSLFVTLERRRTFLAEAPAGTDLSFAELGNDILVEIGQTPVTVLPYSPDLHLADA